MHYIDQWKALSARIRGLAEAVEYDHRFFCKENTGNGRFLCKQAHEIVEPLEQLKTILGHSGPATAFSAVERVLGYEKINGRGRMREAAA